MVDFAEHRKALLCNDAQSIADYQSAMGEAVKPFQHGCKMIKCTLAVALKICVKQFLLLLQKKV
jgi:hypothetical protein